MKILCFLLCIASAKAYYESDDTAEKSKIVQGESTKVELVPYQVGLLTNWKSGKAQSVSCGGTIIHRSWVLTAAHCFDKNRTTSMITGAQSRFYKDGFSEHQIAFVIKHPLYNNVTLDNDIALIKLTKPIEFNKQQHAIDIARWDEAPQENQQMQISGYGDEKYEGTVSRWLKKAYVPVANQKSCTDNYRGRRVTENMFCAGDGTADACQGDSGGPGVINNKLHGIVSWGVGCGAGNLPGVYIRVHKYYHWIVETILKYPKRYKPQ